MALYRYFYEHGTPQAVITELAKYQNADGGFGHGLEADNWNPYSNPIATNDAIITLYRTGALDKDSAMVKGIVRYLSSHDSFDEEKRRWLFAIDSNEDYPHAAWWKKDGDGIDHFNPTVSLAAFMVCFGNESAEEYYANIIREAFAALDEIKDFADELKCYMLAHQMLSDFGKNDVIDIEAAAKEIEHKLLDCICNDISKYGVEYVPVPSDFFYGIYKMFVTDAIYPLIRAEKEMLEKIQKGDGSFDISWRWYTDYKEFETARDWWRPRLTLDKLLFFEEKF